MTRSPLFPVLPALALALAGLAPAPAPAQKAKDLPPALEAKIAEARDACTRLDGGRFEMEAGAVTRVDLDGDGAADWALDESGFFCSAALSFYCGTGGCMTHFAVGGTVISMLNRGWQVVAFGATPVLLADVHGSQCGGINPTPCVTAAVWDRQESRWRSAAALWD